MKIEKTNLPVFSIPFDEESISMAVKRIYKERATGK
jgi:hypothetical protein